MPSCHMKCLITALHSRPPQSLILRPCLHSWALGSCSSRRSSAENRLRGAGVDCLHPELPVQFSCFQLSARAPCRCAPDALLKAITSHISHKPPRRFAPCRLDADDILSRSSWQTQQLSCVSMAVSEATPIYCLRGVAREQPSTNDGPTCNTPYQHDG